MTEATLKAIAKVKKELEKDEYGLYVNCPGYATTRADIEVMERAPFLFAIPQ